MALSRTDTESGFIRIGGVDLINLYILQGRKQMFSTVINRFIPVNRQTNQT